MIYLKGLPTNAGSVKEITIEQKDFSHLPSKCYWCSKEHQNKGSMICGECKRPDKIDHPKVILKGNGWTKTQEFQKNNVDKDTGQVVEKKIKFSFKDYD